MLNGVLPLHAACAGGNEVVVRYLIEEGADVNAPRLPRRYSSEKHRTSGLAVGASGELISFPKNYNSQFPFSHPVHVQQSLDVVNFKISNTRSAHPLCFCIRARCLD